ncbi:MAG: tetratricopeptide repeat protein, partial [Planctomycetota bacterium]|nr:tetratricopeptide repeat protein [Planctomycetota bacterium]
RWARRHRTLVTTVAGVLLVAVFALSVGNFLLADANERVNTQRDIAEENGERAEKNFHRALGAVDEFLTKVSQNKLLGVPGMHSLRRDLLESALTYYEAFANEDSDNPAMQAQLADAHNRIGLIHLTLGSNDKARESFDTAMELQDRLPDDELSTTRRIKYLTDLGALHEATGDSAAALSSHNTAIELLDQYVGSHPGDARAKSNLAAGQARVGRLLHRTQSIDAARKKADAAVKIYLALIEEHPKNWAVVMGFANSLAFRGMLQRDAGQGAAALQSFAESLSHLEPLRESRGSDMELRAILSNCYHSQALLLRNQNRIEEAEASFASAIELRKSLTRDFPTVPQNWSELATTYNSLGVLHWRVQEWEKALSYYRLASEQQQRLVDDFPKTPLFREDLASSYNNIAMIHRQREDHEKAIAAYGIAIEIHQKLAEVSPDSTVNQLALGNAFRNLGRAYRAQDKHQQMLESCDQSIGVLEPLRQRVGDDPRVIYHLRRAHWDRAEALLNVDRPGDAVAAWGAAWKYDDGRERDYIAMQRCHARASSGDHLQATMEAKQLSDTKSLDAETTYDGARVYAVAISVLADDSTLTATDRTTAAKAYAQEAMALLKLAQMRGHFDSAENREHFTEESDFQSLRDRKDFKDFVSQLPVKDAESQGDQSPQPKS